MSAGALHAATRALAEGCARAAIEGADPCRAVRERWPEGMADGPRVYAVAIGKASVGMARGAHEKLGARLAGGVLLCPPELEGDAANLTGFEAHACDHPVPSERNVRASERAAQMVSGLGSGDTLLVLVSGGGSAHLTLPKPGVTLAEVRHETEALLRRGATIREMNEARVALERLKAGGLAVLALAQGVVVRALAVSDVVGDDPAVIASGPTVPGAAPVIVANRRDAAGGATRWLREQGWNANEDEYAIEGDVARVSARVTPMARALKPGEACVLSGETTVDVGDETGRGGRSRELALRLAVELDHEPDLWWTAFGTDGVDGAPEGGRAVAGAWAMGGLLGEARAFGLDAEAALARHDSGPFWAAIGAATGAAMGQEIVTGVTGTNVGDVVVLGRHGEV